MIKKTIIVLFTTGLMVAGPSLADTLEDAMTSFQEGDFKEAEGDWQTLAAEDNLDALFNLGQMYRLGQGAAFDDTRAAEYYLSAALLGHTAAQRELANLYFFAPGTTELKAAAIDWWLQAAEAGDGRAQYILGILYFNGDAVPQDVAAGFAWTLLAVDAGVPEAIQSEAAMRGQLSPHELEKSHDLSRSLMKSLPHQARFPLLIGEPPETPRALFIPPRTVEVVEAPDMALPAEEKTPAETNLDVTVPEKKSAEVLSEEVITEAIPEQVPEVLPAEELATQAQDTVVSDTPPPALEDEPSTPEIIPVEAYDLGDPLSPLVAMEIFSPDWSVQLTSFRRPENAETHWQEVLVLYPDIFTGLEKRIVRADLGPERGVYYRLRIGPFADKVAADSKCQELTDVGLGCLVIWP